MKLRGLSPSSYIHVSLSDLYTIGLPILLQENRWTDRGNIQIAQKHDCERRAVPFLGVHKSDFLCTLAQT